MSTSISAILSERLNAQNALSAPSANPKTATSNADPADGSASISANDFLTLLVTEMKNQDPTANTDPNEYINQLVQVNSLEQLISINQTLSGDSASAAATGIIRQPAFTQPAAVSDGSLITNEITAASKQANADSDPRRTVQGNLTLPATAPAAQRVAESLGVSSRVR